MIKKLTLAILSLLSLQIIAQENKAIEAIRISTPIKIDGVLNEKEWKNAQTATNFTQNNPKPGKPASQKTEVRVLYDNTAIYIGATMYDVSRDSILRQLSNRDEEDNTDIFGVFLDTYNDDQNAYGFVVHPTGVQWDARYSPNGQDVSWDAVWMSNTSIDEKNWYVEIKIPFSAIRFSDSESQTWGINFARKIRRIREFSYWNPVLPSVNGFVRQFGDLTGIENIKAPPRLAFIPYVSGQASTYTDKPNAINEFDHNFRGGMDLKYGLNDAFTLDVTLVPDFGQVQSDNQVLNLSPFEVFFQERRPFFMEGTELFNKANLFYSRRIGGTPIDFDLPSSLLDSGDVILSNPIETQLVNSTKISGRTKKKLGIGILNSVVGKTEAEIERLEGTREKITTSPLTNYNVFVLDQTLKNNSFISFTNTNTNRKGNYRDANVSGLNFEVQNKKNSYAVFGNGSVTQVSDSINFLEGISLNKNSKIGHNYLIGFKKISGNFQFATWYEDFSDKYDKTDLGFQGPNNFKEFRASISYNTFEPNIFNSTRHNFNWGYMHAYNPNTFMKTGLGTDHVFTTKKFHSFGIWNWLEPTKIYDYFETRTLHRYYLHPENFNVGGWISSDYRKAFALDISTNYRFYNETGRYRHNYSISPRFRVNDHLSFVYRAGANNFINDVGWANSIGINNDTLIFTKRDVHTLEQSLQGNYIFTNRMGLSFRFRHYWSTADYKEFFLLTKEGKLGNTNYSEYDVDGNSKHDVNFNAFNIDLIYTWVFAPGSQLNITYKNSILSAASVIDRNYFDNINAMTNEPITNSLNIKFLYYLDYLQLRKTKG